VQADTHLRRASGNRGVDQLRVRLGERRRVFTHRAHLIGSPRIAQISEVYVVDLQVRAPGCCKIGDLFPVDSGKVRRRTRRGRGRPADRSTPRPPRKCTSVGEGIVSFGVVWASSAESEMLDEDRCRPRDFPVTASAVGARCSAPSAMRAAPSVMFVILGGSRGSRCCDEIPVRHDLETDALLPRDGCADRVVFDLAQALCGEGSIVNGVPGATMARRPATSFRPGQRGTALVSLLHSRAPLSSAFRLPPLRSQDAAILVLSSAVHPSRYMPSAASIGLSETEKRIASVEDSLTCRWRIQLGTTNVSRSFHSMTVSPHTVFPLPSTTW